jgi:hypothetical protein
MNGNSHTCDKHKCALNNQLGEQCPYPQTGAVISPLNYCDKHRCIYLLENIGERCSNHVVGAGRFCQKHRSLQSELEVLADLEILKVVSEHYRQDLREFWMRTSLLIGIQTAIAAAYIVTFAEATKNNPMLLHDKIILLVLGTLGLFTAFGWAHISSLSKSWIDRWRSETVKVDEKANRYLSYFREGFHDGKWWNHPTKLVRGIAWTFVVIWMLLVLWMLISLLIC